MQHYVISLAHDQQRREHITQEFGRRGIDFQFLDAVTPDQVPATAQMLGIDLSAQPQLTMGELACFCSHLLAWHTAFASSDAKCAVIFEDDVLLSHSSAIVLQRLSEQCKTQSDPGFDILKLGTDYCLVTKSEMCQHAHMGLPAPFRAFRLQTPLYGMESYVITRQAAHSLMEDVSTLAMQPGALSTIDYFAFDRRKLQQLHIQQLTPAICIQYYVAAPLLNLQLPINKSHLEADRKVVHRARRARLASVRRVADEIARVVRKHWWRHIGAPVPFEDALQPASSS